MSGLSGYQVWPSVASVELTQPVADVVLTPVPAWSALTASVGGMVYKKRDGVVRIPAADLVDAIGRRLTITVRSSQGVYGGRLKFLPADESEPFSKVGGVNKSTGRVISTDAYENTGFVDVQFVSDISLRVYVESSTVCALFAYDEDKNPVRVLVGDTRGQSILHIEPDGSYRYVIASNFVGAIENISLSLHREQTE